MPSVSATLGRRSAQIADPPNPGREQPIGHIGMDVKRGARDSLNATMDSTEDMRNAANDAAPVTAPALMLISSLASSHIRNHLPPHQEPL
jgi:hypothetical protein